MNNNIFGDFTNYNQKFDSKELCPQCKGIMQRWTNFWHESWIHCVNCDLKIKGVFPSIISLYGDRN